MRKTTDQEKKVFEYLNELRESGETNMFGAASYIQDEFEGVSRQEARTLLTTWMKVFNEEGEYGEIDA